VNLINGKNQSSANMAKVFSLINSNVEEEILIAA